MLHLQLHCRESEECTKFCKIAKVKGSAHTSNFPWHSLSGDVIAIVDCLLALRDVEQNWNSTPSDACSVWTGSTLVLGTCKLRPSSFAVLIFLVAHCTRLVHPNLSRGSLGLSRTGRGPSLVGEGNSRNAKNELNSEFRSDLLPLGIKSSCICVGKEVCCTQVSVS